MRQPINHIQDGGAPEHAQDIYRRVKTRYNSIAHDNTIINETDNANAMTLGLVGTMNSTLQNNVMVNGGQLFQTAGGPYLGSPAPMPVNATLSNNTFA